MPAIIDDGRMTDFAPERHTFIDPETRSSNFSDAYGLTYAQLGSTLTELARVQSVVAFTKDDLVGYHHLQYGMHEDIIEDIIDYANRGGERARGVSLAEILPNVLALKTAPAVMERIVLGSPTGRAADFDVTDTSDFLELREGPSHDGDLLCLYPREGYSIMYQGRLTRRMGRVTVNRMITDLTMSTAAINVSGEDTTHRLLVATQGEPPDYGSVVQAMTVFA